MKLTSIDIQLAAAYYPLLVLIARQRSRVTYGDLVEQAMAAYPHDPVVQNAIAVSTGRRLDVVRRFTSSRELPDLTSLVVNSTRGECGSGFTRSFDPEVARDEVYAFDWNSALPEFDLFVNIAKQSLKPRKRLKESAALSIMADHYKLNKNKYPESIRQQRDLLIELIMEGHSVEEAFEQAMELLT